MSRRGLRVIKVGGSLLRYEPLAEALRGWLRSQPSATNVLVVGGGQAADLVREAEMRFALNAEKSHWLAIHAMGLSARLVHSLLPEAVWVDSIAAILAAKETESLLIVDPKSLLQGEDQLGLDRLPHDWTATSDSIAARIAEALDAEELVLLKSAPTPPGNWQQAAARGYVDAYFPVAAAAIKQIRTVNLRDATMEPASPAPAPVAPPSLAQNQFPH